MKKCPACGATHPSSVAGCTACNFEPARVDGFTAYAPAQAHDAVGLIRAGLHLPVGGSGLVIARRQEPE